MQNSAFRNQKLNSSITEIPYSDGADSYIYKRENFLTSAKVKTKQKSKSEKLKTRYRTQDKIVTLLNEVGEKKTADSMALCGQRFSVLTCGQHIVSETPNHRCNVRYCALCASRRSGKYKNKYLPFALDFVKLSDVKLTACLLTLTQKKIKGEKLIHSRERILKSFRKFIRHEFFDIYFDGGLFTVENTVSDEGNHTHLHCVVFRKKFIDHKLLKEHWAIVSPGAENLNIVRIDSLENGLKECIKYVSKPIDIMKFTKQNMLELLEIKGKRMLDTFGKFRTFCRTHELAEVEKQEKTKLEEGQCCFKCNDSNSLLFHIPMTANQRIIFYEQTELTRESPPMLNH